MKRWILERGRISCQRQSYTELSGCWAQRCIACESEGVRLAARSSWTYLKTCNREPGIIFQIGIYVGFFYLYNIYILKTCFLYIIFYILIVVMRHTCQVTNQSSHGELSFHHNPHSCFAGTCASRLFALFGEEAQDWKMQLTLHTVIVVSYAR